MSMFLPIVPLDPAGIAFTAEANQVDTQPGPPLLAPRKQVDFKNMARLATLPATGYSLTEDATGRIAIYLPHLPEDIELPRENTYDQAGNNPVMPDGLWIYQYTNPLEISLVFTLHAFDDLCPEGAKTLLDLASKLHALTLPANNQTLETRSKALAAAASIQFAQSQEAVQNANTTDQQAGTATPNSQTGSKILYPPACSLRLIQAGPRGLGVNCVGFVKSASVTLHGPYLQAADQTNTFNLPSAATYRFTFVHNPAYTNTLKLGRIVQAFGPDIFEYFYNTSHLAPLSQNTYADIEELTR